MYLEIIQKAKEVFGDDYGLIEERANEYAISTVNRTVDILNVLITIALRRGPELVIGESNIRALINEEALHQLI
ncbi:hypothetical protein NSQ91_08945 [Paenibacillus sp. FSL R7-0048]|uniref:hypothetical protein n=1 Tax=Paenibacillus TaxID=44249 RepID=UPI00097007BB|nr:hypothetical protein [Paenibacillus odorifer]OMD00889.1 hypothetical protein BJP46_18850 [Paenibacillus odorifer]OMD73344.1 hypothetical protein BSK48_05635 [Paenibacillus odorifer]